MIEADGHPDWRIDASKSLGAPEERKAGDIARILGIQDEVSEMTGGTLFALAEIRRSAGDGPDAGPCLTNGRPGPTILIIGNSFTANYFPIMLAQHVGRAIWIHHHECGFDWSLIDKFHPDEVWWAPTERFLICDPGMSAPSTFQADLRDGAGSARSASRPSALCVAAISRSPLSSSSRRRWLSATSIPTVRRRCFTRDGGSPAPACRERASNGSGFRPPSTPISRIISACAAP